MASHEEDEAIKGFLERLPSGDLDLVECIALSTFCIGTIGLFLTVLTKLKRLDDLQRTTIKGLCLFISGILFIVCSVAIILLRDFHTMIGYGLSIFGLIIYLIGCIILDECYFKRQQHDKTALPRIPTISSSKNLFVHNSVPKFVTKYFRRDDIVDKVFRAIADVVREPGSGVSVISGYLGVGKTQLVARIFDDYSWLEDNEDYKELVEEHHLKKLVVLWLDCQKYGDGSTKWLSDCVKRKFNDELIAKAKQSFLHFHHNSFRDIASAFLCKQQHALFIFDDLENAELLNYFLSNQSNKAIVSCCIITRDPTSLQQKLPGLIRTPVLVEKVTDTQEFKQIVQTGLGKSAIWPAVEKTLSDDSVVSKLENLCNGLPIVIRLACSAMLCYEHEFGIYRDLMRMEFPPEEFGAPIYLFKNLSLSDIFKNTLKRLPDRLLNRYWYFLLFDVQESVPFDDLHFIWGDHSSGELISNKTAFQLFEKYSLAEKTKISTQRFALRIHKMFFVAALKLVAVKFKKHLMQQVSCCSTNSLTASIVATARDDDKTSRSDISSLFNDERSNVNVSIHSIRIRFMATAGKRYVNCPFIDDATATLVFIAQAVKRRKQNMAFRLLEKLPRNCFRENARCQQQKNPASFLVVTEMLNSQRNDADEPILTLTHIISACGQTHLLRLLCDYSTDRVIAESETRSSQRSETPAHMAVAKGFADIVELLLIANPSIVNIVNSEGDTICHVAARNGDLDTMDILLHVIGRDVAKMTNDKGLTAMALAAEGNHEAVVELLRETLALKKNVCNSKVPHQGPHQNGDEIGSDIIEKVTTVHQTGNSDWENDIIINIDKNAGVHFDIGGDDTDKDKNELPSLLA